MDTERYPASRVSSFPVWQCEETFFSAELQLVECWRVVEASTGTAAAIAKMVVHILGKAVKGKYRINYGLSKTFYGVGLETATKICSKLGFYPDMRMHQLTEQQTMSITKELSEMTIDSKLLSNVKANIKMKREIGSYVGMRHAMALPVRGQRTKTNAKTARKLNRVDRKM